MTFKALAEGRVPVGHLQTTPANGVYALFLANSLSIKTFPAGAEGHVYIGRTSNLEERNVGTHFASGETGFSFPRRSLGAILKDDLKLTAQARSSGNSKSNFLNYAFSPEGEDRLSLWMERNLYVSAVALPLNAEEAMEEELIRTSCPVLNLQGWANPHRKVIKELRKGCANQARRSRGVKEE